MPMCFKGFWVPHSHTCTRTHACMYTHTHTPHTCMCAHTHTHTHMHAHAHTHIHTHLIHTHTLTDIHIFPPLVRLLHSDAKGFWLHIGNSYKFMYFFVVIIQLYGWTS